MTLDTRAYLNLSALAYIDFNKSLTGLTIKDLIERKAVPEDDLNNNPELSSLRDSSNHLRSWKILYSTSTSSGFRAAAFQNPETGEIVFSFKGTDFDFSKTIILANYTMSCYDYS